MGAVSTVEHTYAYAGLSGCGEVGDRRDAYLSSSGGPAAHPHFFSGFLERPRRNGALLLAVARVARARFYTPGSMTAAVLRAADPVVTSCPERLRFESFSACNGVYARLDLSNDVLSGDLARSGTTNVDFNPKMRQALNWLEEDELVHLDVGPDEVRLATLEGSVVERRVPLPERWLRGFGEVQLAQTSMAPRFELTGPAARRALSELALVKGSGERWVRPHPQGVLVAEDSTPNEPAILVDGIERLRPFAEHARHARALRAYSTAEDNWAASAWELALEGATLTIVLSPQIGRGFSGEGQVLTALTDQHAVSTAEAIRGLAMAAAQVDASALAHEAGLEAELVARSLAVLSGLGLLGYDLSLDSYFTRHLPFDADALGVLHPRLAHGHGHQLAADMAVREEGVDGNEVVATVVSGKNEYRVRTSPHASSCTCKWYADKGARQGPCKHVLAVRLQRVSTVPSQP